MITHTYLIIFESALVTFKIPQPRQADLIAKVKLVLDHWLDSYKGPFLTLSDTSDQ